MPLGMAQGSLLALEEADIAVIGSGVIRPEKRWGPREKGRF